MFLLRTRIWNLMARLKTLTCLAAHVNDNRIFWVFARARTPASETAKPASGPPVVQDIRVPPGPAYSTPTPGASSAGCQLGGGVSSAGVSARRTYQQGPCTYKARCIDSVSTPSFLPRYYPYSRYTDLFGKYTELGPVPGYCSADSFCDVYDKHRSRNK